MYKLIRWALLVLFISALSACSSPNDVSQSAQTPKETHQQSTHIYTEQIGALEKSKNLAHTLNQAELNRKKQIAEWSR